MKTVSMDALLRLASKWTGKELPARSVGLSTIELYEASKKSSDAVLENLRFSACFSPSGVITREARIISTTDSATFKNKQNQGEGITMAKRAYGSSDYSDSLDKLLKAVELLVDYMAKDGRRNARQATDDADLIPMPESRARSGQFNPVTRTEDDRSYENLLKYYRGRNPLEGKRAADKAGASPAVAQRPQAYDYATAMDDVAEDFEKKAREMGERKRVINHRPKLR